MYEQLTDRARKAFQLANHAAQQLNHEYIATEHILLGVLREGGGVACVVLKNLGADAAKLEVEVGKLIRPGPDVVTIGKLPQTPRAKKVIEYSIEEARNLNHNYVGTEHLLLGLLREQELHRGARRRPRPRDDEDAAAERRRRHPARGHRRRAGMRG